MNKHKNETYVIGLLLLMVSCSNVSEAATSTTSEPTAFSTGESQTALDLAYFDGIIVITQYYTFLGNGLHEEAYWLLSASAQKPHSFEKYVENTRLAFKTVEIITIQPYYIAEEQLGRITTPDPSNRKRFFVQIRAWGEGNMSGSIKNGELQGLILVLVLENGKWKIDSFATGTGP